MDALTCGESRLSQGRSLVKVAVANGRARDLPIAAPDNGLSQEGG